MKTTKKTRRRDFVLGGLAAAGWGALSAGDAAIVLAADRTAGSIPDAPPKELPPSGRFLEAVIAGDLNAVGQHLAADPGLLHTRDRDGRSAFALALLHRHPDVAGLLRERGHAPDIHESALALDWPLFEGLAATTPGVVNQDHPVGGTAMYAAALGGAGSQIWRVYSRGGEPNEDPRGTEGHTAVRAALEFPDLATAELTVAALLGNGASPNGAQPGGSSALHAAARLGSVDVVELLIRKGADLDAKDQRGRTALALAEENGRSEVADLLRRHREIARDHSSSRWAYDVEGKPYRAPELSAFSVVARGQVVGQSHRDLEAVRSAVDRNPELAHAMATTTEAAVEAGAHMGRHDIVDYLLKNGAPCSLPTAVMRNDLTRARALLEEDRLRINERGAHDFPLLWYPVIGKGLIEMAELLFEFGADVERQHWLGTTALHYAAVGGQVDMAAFLIDHGANVERVGRKFDPAGITPLGIAESRDRTEVARLLRERGARR